MKRKIYLFILAFLLSFATIGCQNAYITADSPTVNYLTLTFYDDMYYDLSTGLQYDDTTDNNNLPFDSDYAGGWSISAKAPVPNVDTFDLDSLDFHYLLFWKNGTFLGYYSVPGNNASHVTGAYLGTIASTTITPPATATHWAIMANKLGEDTPSTHWAIEDTPYTLGYTFDDIFSTYNDSPVVYPDWELWDIFDEIQAIANNKYDYLDDTTELLPNAPLRTLTEFGVDIFANNRVMTINGVATTESSESLYVSNLTADTFENHLSISVSLNSEFDTSDFTIYYVDNNGDFNDLQTFSDYNGNNTYTYEITDGFRNIGIFYYEEESYGLQMAFSLNPYIPYNFVTDLDSNIYEGLSLRDIFETNALISEQFDNLGKWSTFIDRTLLTVLNNELNIELLQANSISSTNFRYLSLATNNNDMYFAFKFKPVNNMNLRISYSNLDITFSNLIGGEYNFKSHIYSNVGASTNIDFLGNYDITHSINDILYMKYFYWIDLSIFTTAPSQAQLDEWLDMYLTLKEGELLDIPENYVFYQTDEANLNGYKNVFLDLDQFDTVFNWNETTAKYYYDLFIDSIYGVPRYEFYTFENDATADEFEEYQQEYEDLLALTPILFDTFNDNQGVYSFTEMVIDDVDNIINNFLADLGLGTFGKFLIFIVIVIAISILLAVLHLPMIMILFIDILFLLLTFLLGWIPAWVGILIIILLFAYLVMKLIGGRGGSD